MKHILHAVITVIVFWIGAQYFPEYISIDSDRTLFLVVLLSIAFHFSFVGLFWASFLAIIAGIGIGWLLFAAMIAFGLVWVPIRLWLVELFLPGFDIHGFGTYVLLTIVLWMFSWRPTNTQNKE